MAEDRPQLSQQRDKEINAGPVYRPEWGYR